MYFYVLLSDFIKSTLCQTWLSKDLAAAVLDYVETTDRLHKLSPGYYCPLVGIVSPSVVLCKYRPNSWGLAVQQTHYT